MNSKFVTFPVNTIPQNIQEYNAVCIEKKVMLNDGKAPDGRIIKKGTYIYMIKFIHKSFNVLHCDISSDGRYENLDNRILNSLMDSEFLKNCLTGNKFKVLNLKLDSIGRLIVDKSWQKQYISNIDTNEENDENDTTRTLLYKYIKNSFNLKHSFRIGEHINESLPLSETLSYMFDKELLPILLEYVKEFCNDDWDYDGGYTLGKVMDLVEEVVNQVLEELESQGTIVYKAFGRPDCEGYSSMAWATTPQHFILEVDTLYIYLADWINQCYDRFIKHTCSTYIYGNNGCTLGLTHEERVELNKCNNLSELKSNSLKNKLVQLADMWLSLYNPPVASMWDMNEYVFSFNAEGYSLLETLKNKMTTQDEFNKIIDNVEAVKHLVKDIPEEDIVGYEGFKNPKPYITSVLKKANTYYSEAVKSTDGKYNEPVYRTADMDESRIATPEESAALLRTIYEMYRKYDGNIIKLLREDMIEHLGGRMFALRQFHIIVSFDDDNTYTAARVYKLGDIEYSIDKDNGKTIITYIQ